MWHLSQNLFQNNFLQRKKPNQLIYHVFRPQQKLNLPLECNRRRIKQSFLLRLRILNFKRELRVQFRFLQKTKLPRRICLGMAILTKMSSIDSFSTGRYSKIIKSARLKRVKKVKLKAFSNQRLRSRIIWINWVWKVEKEWVWIH